jgi:hypothetical protein
LNGTVKEELSMTSELAAKTCSFHDWEERSISKHRHSTVPYRTVPYGTRGQEEEGKENSQPFMLDQTADMRFDISVVMSVRR